MKSEPRPGSTLAASHPTRKSTARTVARNHAAAAGPTPASIARMTASCALQGTPRARSKVTITRSLRVSMIRAVMVAMVSQPRPRTIGRTALPFSPMRLKRVFTTTARRGR